MAPACRSKGINNKDFYRLNERWQLHRFRRLREHNQRPLNLKHFNSSWTHSVIGSPKCTLMEFRFDLAAALARSFYDVDMLGNFLTTIQQDPILRRVKLIAEPWDIGPGGLSGRLISTFVE